MKISVILGPPSPESFNAAIARIVVRTLLGHGHTVHFHDLYQEKFDPLLQGAELARDRAAEARAAEHQRQIKLAEGIVIIHPDGWGQPPAIRKGWLGRVLRENVAYAFPPGNGGLPIGLLQARAALVFNASNTPEQREASVFGDSPERIWKDCILGFCGVTVVARKLFCSIAGSSQAQREEWLEQARETTSSFFPRRNG